MIMPFGKHKGEPLSELPKDYLQWLYDECSLRDDLRRAVEDELEERADEELHKGYGDYWEKRRG